MSNKDRITRRRVIQAGTLGAIAASLLGASGIAPLPTATVSPAPTIERVEALIIELCGIVPHLSPRDMGNVAQLLDELGEIDAATRDEVMAAIRATLAYVGPGNRVHDRIDRREAAARQASVTHAAIVERYARRYAVMRLGESSEIHSELVERYGDDLGRAIEDAAFHWHLHDLYHAASVNPSTCEKCWEPDPAGWVDGPTA